ncbi:MAG: hypothetical protein M5U01_10025 [Ardenticatenaceae bacterium]|nr:hypothetical protein [Ardenticatenaceae bacterium]
MSANANGAPAPLPEAPASATLRVHLRGYDLLLTLRDHSGLALLEKVTAAIDHLERLGATPAPTHDAGRAGSGSPQAAGAGGAAPRCPTHGREMKPARRGGWFCPARIADDDGSGKPAYCRHKVS